MQKCGFVREGGYGLIKVVPFSPNIGFYYGLCIQIRAGRRMTDFWDKSVIRLSAWFFLHKPW